MDAAAMRVSVWRPAALVVSVLLCLVLAICHWLQPDWLAALTLVPVWFWLLPACLLVRLGFERKHWRSAAAVLLLWLGFVIAWDEGLRSLAWIGRRPTAQWVAARREGRAVRVVSLNCGLGSAPSAAAEVVRYDPDIVLLQESPGQEEVERLARELFGSNGGVVWSYDTSILARGRVVPPAGFRPSHFVRATVTLPSGFEVDVVSLRLSPPVTDLTFWTPGFWRSHWENRVRHRDEIQEVMDSLKDCPESAHLIVGGDFNAPAGDGALTPLHGRLHDSFREAGRGWANTGTNDSPLFRVDQIWTSGRLHAEAVTARSTVHSDHRIVVCDLVIGP